MVTPFPAGWPPAEPEDRIDAHQHYWDVGQAFPVDDLPWVLGAVTYGWQRAALPQLDRDFLPADLEPQLRDRKISRTVLVNAIHSRGETRWMLALADAHPTVAGVVGWVNLAQPAELVGRDLDRLAHPKLVGIRHLAQFEPDPRWLLRPDVTAGLGLLADRGIPYDLLLTPDHLAVVPTLSERHPDLDLVVDHLAKPDIAGGKLEPWATDLRRAAANPRLRCKVSGLVTEADHRRWTPDDLAPFVAVALEAFGPERLMFGSDWPVCTLAGDYGRVCDALEYALERGLGGPPDAATARAVFGGTAAAVYRLGPGMPTR